VAVQFSAVIHMNDGIADFSGDHDGSGSRRITVQMIEQGGLSLFSSPPLR